MNILRRRKWLRDEQAREAFDAAMAEEAENYRRIAELLKDGHIRRLMQEGADEKNGRAQGGKNGH